jgi:hypothetical protein
MNFSYWLFKTRLLLREYFAAVHRNLKRDGLFILDCYGGYDAFRVLRERRQYRTHNYVWHQASYNPISGLMNCHIHFTFRDGSKLPEAFSYEWRLWTLPELRELLAEAGFSKSIIYWQGWDEKTGEPNGQFAIEAAPPLRPAWLPEGREATLKHFTTRLAKEGLVPLFARAPEQWHHYSRLEK